MSRDNMAIPIFDTKVEYILANIILNAKAGHAIRKYLDTQDVYVLHDFQLMRSALVHKIEYVKTPATNNAPDLMAKLTDTNATKLQAAIEYSQYLIRIKDKDVHDPQNWDQDDYRQ